APVRAPGDEDVVEVGVGPLLYAGLPGGVDVVHVVGGGIGDDGALVVVECRVPGRPSLADHRIAHLRPRGAIVVPPLDMSQRVVPGVVVRDVDSRAVGGDPAPVGAGGSDDLRRAVVRPHGAAG